MMNTDSAHYPRGNPAAGLTHTSANANAGRDDAQFTAQSLQVIASRTTTHDVLESLMRLSLTGASAQKACVLLREPDSLSLAGDAERVGENVTINIPGKQSISELPAKLLRTHVRRTQQTVWLSAQGRRPSNDAANGAPDSSAVCVPLMLQARLVGLLYVETAPDADKFSIEQTHFLELIAAQAAVSLSNASPEIARCTLSKRRGHMEAASPTHGLTFRKRERPYRELRQEVREYRQLFENTWDGFFNLDVTAAGEYVVCGMNRAFENVMGRPRAQIVGRPIDDIIKDQDTLQLTTSRYDRCVATGMPVQYEVSHVFGTTRRLLDVTLVPLRHANGRVYRLSAVVRDITEAKRLEEALRQSEKRYRDVFDNTSDGIIIIDITDDGRFRLADINPTAARNTGYRHKPGIFMDEMGTPEISEVLALYRACVESCAPASMEAEFRLPIGKRWNHVTAIPLLDADRRPYRIVALGRDIDDRKRAAELQERTREELERRVLERTEALARSNSELEQMAYVASHDLQEPLRMVGSYLQLLERRHGGKLDGEAREFMEYAIDGATRMRTLINDLLAYSRVGTRPAVLEPIDCAAVVKSVMRNLSITIQESGATVQIESLPTVHGDKTQLAQLFQNLLSNALKFRSEKAPEIVVRAERQSDCWCFSVEDNGIGIAPQYLDRIFVLFQRLHTRASYAGTGIGLAVCKKIVERHGGRIWAESEPDRGTKMRFTIPCPGE